MAHCWFRGRLIRAVVMGSGLGGGKKIEKLEFLKILSMDFFEFRGGDWGRKKRFRGARACKSLCRILRNLVELVSAAAHKGVCNGKWSGWG